MAIKFSGGFKPPEGLRVKKSAPQGLLGTGTGSTGRNIALLGTNGLTTASYSYEPKTYLWVQVPEGACDGFQSNSQINNDQTEGKQEAGNWQYLNPGRVFLPGWFQISFGAQYQVSGIQIYRLTGAKMPKDCTFQYSTDGTNFTDGDSFTLTTAVSQIVEFSETVVGQYFRLYWQNGYNDQHGYIGFGELELLKPAT